MKKIVAVALCLVLAFSLAGCGKNVSSYKAVGFVHSSGPASAFMNFCSFDGRMVFKLKSGGESELKYSAKLESGNATVYCECSGTVTELFSLAGGDETDSCSGPLEAGKVYIIVETEGTCQNGEFRFSLE